MSVPTTSAPIASPSHHARHARQTSGGPTMPAVLSAATPMDALMMGATADHILRTSTQTGVDIELPTAVKSHYDRTIAAGHGTKNWTALYEVIKAGR